jgi:hypothetical protein
LPSDTLWLYDKNPMMSKKEYHSVLPELVILAILACIFYYEWYSVAQPRSFCSKSKRRCNTIDFMRETASARLGSACLQRARPGPHPLSVKSFMGKQATEFSYAVRLCRVFNNFGQF